MIRKLRKEGAPVFVTGVEFSCKDENGKYHILGYAYDTKSRTVRDLVLKCHENRMTKVWDRLDGLKDEFHITFPEE